MLNFARLNERDFFAPLYYQMEISADEMAKFEKLVRIYQTNLKKNAHQNEDAIVANALNPLFQGLKFDTIIKDKQKGNSEVDLLIRKNEVTQVIIEAKKQSSKEMITRCDFNRILYKNLKKRKRAIAFAK